MAEPKTRKNPAQELEALKQHDFEMSTASGEIHTAGSMKDIDPEAQWQGTVSIEEKIKSGELTYKDIEVGFELVNGLYVPTTEGAAVRCGDERKDEGYDNNNPDDYTDPLAPQLLGGVIAVAKALWNFEMIKNPGYQGTILDKMEEAIALVQALGYSGGVHGDDAKGKAGCGGAATISGQIMIIGAGTQGFRNLVAGYMGDRYEDNCLQLISETANREILAAGIRIPSAEELVDEALKSNPGGYVQKVGPHPGVGVVKNLVKGSTLHINHLNTETKGKLPFFNVDAWFDQDLAEAKAPNSKEDQLIIEHLRATQTIATSMMLKDGSLHFGVRYPRNSLA